MRSLILTISNRVIKFCYDKSPLQTFEGIRICDIVSTNGTQREQFRTAIVEALTLVQANDARRFRRIQKNIDYIVNDRCVGRASYNASRRTCTVGFAQFQHLQDEINGLSLARSLVHEATHGAIYSWGIGTDQGHRSVDYRLRVECLCHREEARFVGRAWPGAKIEPFDENWHREYYQAWVGRRTPRFIRRLRRVDRAAV